VGEFAEQESAQRQREAELERALHCRLQDGELRGSELERGRAEDHGTLQDLDSELRHLREFTDKTDQTEEDHEIPEKEQPEDLEEIPQKGQDEVPPRSEKSGAGDGKTPWTAIATAVALVIAAA